MTRRLRWWLADVATRHAHRRTRRILDQMATETGRMDPADIPATHIHTRGPHEGEPVARQGRKLASEREDLIAQGVDPADLIVPIHPEDR